VPFGPPKEGATAQEGPLLVMLCPLGSRKRDLGMLVSGLVKDLASCIVHGM